MYVPLVFSAESNICWQMHTLCCQPVSLETTGLSSFGTCNKDAKVLHLGAPTRTMVWGGRGIPFPPLTGGGGGVGVL